MMMAWLAVVYIVAIVHVFLTSVYNSVLCTLLSLRSCFLHIYLLYGRTLFSLIILFFAEEVGVDMQGVFPKPLHDRVMEAMDVSVTMGCGDVCPVCK